MHSTKSRLVFVAIALLVLLGVGAYLLSYRTSLKDTITVPATVTATQTSTHTMRFEIADTEAKQELGLGNRASIPDNYGMLFVFPKPDRYGFWMKDMLEPIDIIWLSDNGTVMLIDASVDPSTYPHAFYPPNPVKYVLETRAGYAHDHGWQVGTKVTLPAPYGS